MFFEALVVSVKGKSLMFKHIWQLRRLFFYAGILPRMKQDSITAVDPNLIPQKQREEVAAAVNR